MVSHATEDGAFVVVGAADTGDWDVPPQTPRPSSDAVVCPPAMQLFLLLLHPHAPVQSLLHMIEAHGVGAEVVGMPAGVGATDATGARVVTVHPGPSPVSDAVVRPPATQTLLLLLHPQPPVQSSLHVIDAHGVGAEVAVGAEVVVGEGVTADVGAETAACCVVPPIVHPGPNPVSDAVVRPPTMQLFLLTLQPQSPVQSSLHVTAAQGVGDDVGLVVGLPGEGGWVVVG